MTTAAGLVCVVAAAALVGAAETTTAARVAAPVVVVDPGHDRYANPRLEPIGPGSTERKVMDSGGTRGVVSGVAEADVNLAVSLRLRALLRRAGVEVVLTRTATRGVSMGNVARARIANRAAARLFVRVHADGSENARERGTHTVYPALRRGWTDDIHRPSLRAARLLQGELVRALGSRDRGLDPRSDITAFNWSDVPAVLPELGFLTNAREDRLLTSARYQQRAAAGLCRGILRFLGLPASRCG